MAAHATPPSWQSLDHGWQFRLASGDTHAGAHPGATHWHSAHVPGAVQTDLMAHKLTPNPYWRANEATIQWVGLSDWEYRTHFRVDAATLARRHVDLVFDGLDTFADVYVNGHKLLSADNMFRRWRVSAKPWLHAGENTLTVKLYSPIKRLQPWLLKQPYALPGEFDSAFGDEPKGKQTANYIRKAKYQYGWDWGPRIVTEGIWKPVRLESWDGPRVADFHIAQRRVDAQVARLQAQVAVDTDRTDHVHVAIDVIGPHGHTVGHVERDAVVDPGTDHLDLPIRIAHPQRWYPAGYGPQSMYTFRATVSDADGVQYRGSKATGLRSVVLRRHKDQWGKSFEFVVNGIPIFAKGANLIPFDSFPDRASKAQMRHILKSARDAHMNMLRMWGGGYYETDAFYTMADRMGIMIWQEFMFGGAIPPYDVAYRENTRQEAIQQVKRLRDHPSIVLWCGNNEVQTGWESWGDRQKFKKSISESERERIVTGMVNLFSNVLRGVVSRYEPSVPYWAGSPGTDYDGPANVLDNGDYHYWNVWSGKAEPVTQYLHVTPRFESEYGLQSMPVMRTIDAFTKPSDRHAESKVMRAHQKYDNGNGNQRLLKYIHREYGSPKDFASFVYLSQVMQAEGIQLNAEHLRASRPQSMGSLYWQLNDVWPGASWSSIDWYGRWKALQFHARRFYAPLLVAALRDEGKTAVSLVSDRTTPLKAHWRVQVMDFDGKVLRTQDHAVTLPPLSSTHVADLADAALLHGAAPDHTVAVFTLDVDGHAVSRNLVYFDHARDLKLPDPGLHTTLQRDGDGYRLHIGAKRLAREVWVSFGKIDATLSDNSFTLLPGQSRDIHVTSKASLAALRQALQLQSLATATKPATASP